MTRRDTHQEPASWTKAERAALKAPTTRQAAARWRSLTLAHVGLTARLGREQAVPTIAAAMATRKAYLLRPIVTAFDPTHQPKAWHCHCVTCQRAVWDRAVGRRTRKRVHRSVSGGEGERP